ncbi:MAG: ThiF family adenylyltransferase [bacterium]|nr:ThiF family adenylyltransferase [bacterium]
MPYRTDGLIDLKLIEATKIVIVGAGSLGSLLASLLVYPWRQIVIIDPEVLRKENVERHLLGRSWIGKPKAEGVFECLEDAGVPRILPLVAPVEDVLDAHRDADIIVLTTGSDAVSSWVNQWNSFGIPMIIGGVYPQGIGGEATALPNPKKVCFLCAQSQFVRNGHEYQPGNYGIPPDSQDLRAVPALKYAVMDIAGLCAWLVLAVIQKEEPAQTIQWFGKWTQALTLPEGGGRLRRLMGAWFYAQRVLGMSPSIWLGRRCRDREVSFRGSRLYWPLERWAGCPFHESAIRRLEEI